MCASVPTHFKATCLLNSKPFDCSNSACLRCVCVCVEGGALAVARSGALLTLSSGSADYRALDARSAAPLQVIRFGLAVVGIPRRVLTSEELRSESKLLDAPVRHFHRGTMHRTPSRAEQTCPRPPRIRCAYTS